MEKTPDADKLVEDYKPGDEIALVILTEEDLQRGDTEYVKTLKSDL